MNHGPHKGVRRAFTLVELLVVIAIVTLLMGLLLPSLNKARRAARTVYCLANLRSIGQAMIAYTAENNGWLPGSGWTSGAMFWNFSTSPPSPAISNPLYSISYSPGLNESNDWIGPLARQMGIKDPAIDGNDDVARYRAYRAMQCMTCPAYGDMPVPASFNSDADAGPGQGLSYCTSLIFLDRAWETFSAIGQTSLNGNLVLPADATGHRGVVTLPPNYAPRITDISGSSAKIFAADGARTILPVVSDGHRIEQSPVYIISASPGVTNWDNTSYADYGAFGGWSHSFYRTAVPGNSTNPPSLDLRLWAYRHGSQGGFQSAGSYRMNAVYFDGHAETLDDVTAANPALWMPRGSVIYPASGCGAVSVKGTKTVWSDVMSRYCPGVSGTNDPWTSP
jgi:prepilin-type N-terminal cleavage/methylation domain-containing protein/prepilin-type processing-associated H-X9-DG protein